MKLLTFLFILGSLSLGFAGGMAFMTVYYKSLLNELRKENRALHSTNRMLKASKKDTVEVFYCPDGCPTENPPEDYRKNYFDPF